LRPTQAEMGTLADRSDHQKRVQSEFNEIEPEPEVSNQQVCEITNIVLISFLRK